MTAVRITDDTTPDEIEAIGHLRAKQRAAVIASTAREYADAIDELFEERARRA